MALFASLPMYDWPEIRGSTDRLWLALAGRLCDLGFERAELPGLLNREGDPHKDWLRDDLLISQTCGLPYVRELRGRVVMLGTPVYDLPERFGCGIGEYCSVIISGSANAEPPVSALAGGRLAVNDLRSQSGHAAFFQYLTEAGVDRFDGKRVISGSHRNSIAMVASGEAEFAAIDLVSWELALRHEPAAQSVHVVASTRPTPGLPLITSLALASRRGSIAQAVDETIAGLSRADRERLLLHGFLMRTDSDYDSIRSGWQAVADAGLLDEPRPGN